MILHPDDICAQCGHSFKEHGFYITIDTEKDLEEPFRSHIDCKKITGTDEHGYSTQCECCNFIPVNLNI